MISVLTGAGISAESGLSTFRDAGGLWEGHDIMEVASPEGWAKNSALVNQFYNQRRRDLKNVRPNAAHQFFADLESRHPVRIITQNVDDLHERAGSTHVVHLHGELTKVRSTSHPNLIYKWHEDITPDDSCEMGSPLRPHIVWFGEAVPELDRAAKLVEQSDLLIIVGTSLQVYPAAGLIHYASGDVPVIYVDPRPALDSFGRRQHFYLIEKNATAAMDDVRVYIEQFLGT